MNLIRSGMPLAVAGLVAVAVFYAWKRSASLDPVDAPPVDHAPSPRLSDLATVPAWSALEAWQEALTRDEFVSVMDEVFTVSPAWREWFVVEAGQVTVTTENPDAPFVLRFADAPRDPRARRYWRRVDELPPLQTSGRPLEDLRIAIDPGHIGGPWAKVEERWFQVGDAEPVTEGDMTLKVAKLLKPRLESLGATVTLLRDDTQPVTDYRPATLLDEASQRSPDSPAKLAERLFYRTAEIRARAAKVNRTLRPDLVLCLHFNAEAWGDPEAPSLVDRNHFHLLLNGAYTDHEVSLADQRFEMLAKIVERIHPEEAALSAAVAASFVEHTGLPPFRYEPHSSRAVNVDGNPYLWARNLLANRLYRCPVLFLEPYVMNSKEVHARIQAGDYPGVREIHGVNYPSIYREYVEGLTDGLTSYYRTHRNR